MNPIAAEKSELAVLFFFGTSCAGKSSLSEQVQKALGKTWKLIDRDDVIDEQKKRVPLQDNPQRLNTIYDEIEKQADDFVLEKIGCLFKERFNVIVDTQYHQNLLDKLKSYRTFSVLVYAPLSTLLERDEKRNRVISRTESQQFYARAFILDTFAGLYTLEKKQRNIEGIDEINPLNLDKGILDSCDETETKAFFTSLLDSQELIPLYCKEFFNVVVNSERQTLEESIQKITSLFKGADYQS